MDYLFQDGGKSKSKTKTSTKKGGNFLGAVGELVAPTGWEGFATAAGLLAIDRADAALRRGATKKKSEKSSANKGGSTKKTSSKKGGNFLGAVGELVAPTGWEGFATAAGLLAIDRADAALRRGTSKKKSEKSSANKGGTTKKTSSKKGGNFLGAVGELVAPTGWESFATTAGLFALDRADAALRRGKSTKNSAKKGGMRGGYSIEELEMILATIQQILSETGNLSENNGYTLADIRGSYSDFLELYKDFLKNKEQKPKITNSPEKKQKYILDMKHKLSLMISHLRGVRGVIQGIKNSHIPKNKIDRLEFLIPEINRIIDFLTFQHDGFLIEELEIIQETIQEILNESGNLSENNGGNALLSIHGSYASFLNLYKQFLENIKQNPKNTNSPEKKQKYKLDMKHKLSLMISHLRGVRGVIQGIKNSLIPKNKIDRLEFLIPKIDRIIHFITQQLQSS